MTREEIREYPDRIVGIGELEVLALSLTKVNAGLEDIFSRHPEARKRFYELKKFL